MRFPSKENNVTQTALHVHLLMIPYRLIVGLSSALATDWEGEVPLDDLSQQQQQKLPGQHNAQQETTMRM